MWAVDLFFSLTKKLFIRLKIWFYISVCVCVLYIQHIDTIETTVISCWNKLHVYLLRCLLLTVSMPLPNVNWKLYLTTFFMRNSWFYPQIWSTAQFYWTHMKISARCREAGGLNSHKGLVGFFSVSLVDS